MLCVVQAVSIAFMLMSPDKMGIALRSGHMCAEPLLRRYGQTSMLRASLAPYNTMAECETFVKSLRRAVDMLR